MSIMPGGNRVRICLVMSQMPHPAAGKVKACNNGDHDDRNCT
jgi:hypothetical protein